jgi:outer membrane protein assembly factor BamA
MVRRIHIGPSVPAGRARKCRSALRAVVLGMAAVLIAATASAQEPQTREEADRQRREENAVNATPYQPNGLERAINSAEDRAVFILDREGFHPKLGSLTTGSGFAYGVGFRDRDLFSNRGMFEVWGAGSIKGYWATEARLTFPRLADDRLYLAAWASRRDYPEESFFGLGPDSARDARSDYAIRTNHFGGRAGVRPVSHLLVGGGLEYLQPRLGQGQNDDYPDITETFPPSDLPGAGTRADFLRSDAFVEVDYREPINARQGGWYRFDYSHYADRTAGQFTFDRFDGDVRQFFGFLAGRRVIAVRLAASTSETRDGQTMPFYFMRTLGGNDTLRGFREYRFRGPHAILAQAEYRWEIWSGFDGALFADAGKVADRRQDLNFRNLETDYGIGFRFNTDSGVILRVDTALGSRDGKHLYIVFGGVF